MESINALSSRYIFSTHQIIATQFIFCSLLPAALQAVELLFKTVDRHNF
jgi:hypothetical protein